RFRGGPCRGPNHHDGAREPGKVQAQRLRSLDNRFDALGARKDDAVQTVPHPKPLVQLSQIRRRRHTNGGEGDCATSVFSHRVSESFDEIFRGSHENRSAIERMSHGDASSVTSSSPPPSTSFIQTDSTTRSHWEATPCSSARTTRRPSRAATTARSMLPPPAAPT